MNFHFIIITASYNRPDLLLRNIEAMQAQSYGNWQQIVVDDSSECWMQDVYDLASSDERIHVIQLDHNQGCNHARNIALEYIRNAGLSGYVSLVDDDDFLVPDALGKVNEQLNQEEVLWLTADCIYPDKSKASKLSTYGKLSYINNYMYGREIKGDLNHFIHTSVCSDLRFSEEFKNGQEWSFYCQLSGRTSLKAINLDVKVVEYLEGGLSKTKVSAQDKIKVFKYKIHVLRELVSARKLSHQQLLLARELIEYGNSQGARKLLNSIFKYQLFSFRFYRYYFKSLV